MANNDVLKISPDELGEIVKKLVKNKLMMITQQKPGQSPGDDKTGDNRHDKGWPPPAPLAPKLAGGPSFDIGPGHGKVRKKALGFNKTRNNPSDKEVEMIKKWLGGPQLPDVSGSEIYKGIPNKFDQILDPSGTQKVRPTLDQLREGVRHKKGLA